MKNVSIKKRVRKNNNNKKYNKTQTKRSRRNKTQRNKTQRNKTQRNNRRRRNFRNKTRRGGAPHGPSPLREGIKAYGVPISSAVRKAHGYGTNASKSRRAHTKSFARRAAAALFCPSTPTSIRRGINLPPLDMESRSILCKKSYYNPGSIDVDEVEEDISVEIQRMTDEIGPLFLEIKELEKKNTELQGEITGKPYLSASAEERSIMNGSIGDQVRQNYSEIAEKKEKIDSLKRLITGNEDAMNKLAKNIATIINTSKIHEKEYEANTPHGIITTQMIERGPGDKESWRFFLIKNLPDILSHYFYKPPGSITS